METRALIELIDRDGLVRQVVRVTAFPVRLGRAIDADVVLDDAHVAARHARLVETESGVALVAEPSVNGVLLGRRRLAEGLPEPVADGSLLTLGTTTLRLRLAGAALAPELPLLRNAGHAGLHASWIALLVLVTALGVVFDQWLGANPGTPASEMTSVFLGVPLAFAAWCAMWALGSKLFQRHFDFWAHLEVALLWSIAAALAARLGDHLAFAFSMPVLATLGHALAIVAFAVLIWRHLGIVLPQRRRQFGWVVAAMVLVGAGLDVAARVRQEQPLAGNLYLSALSPPLLRLVAPVTVDAFVDGAKPLEQRLARWAHDSGDDSDAGDDDD